MDSSVSRTVWAALEPVHSLVYFVPEPKAHYTALGLEPISQYFASRSAPMGAVTHGVVTASFFNFSPGLVERAMRDAWSTASPAEVLVARHAGALEALVRITDGLGLDDTLAELIELGKRATADLDAAGRALFGGHLSLPIPDEPMLAMWHLLSLLREHRGDGHVVALCEAGFSPMDALLTSVGWSKLPLAQLEKLRGWHPEEWEAGRARLQDRGWLTAEGALTAAGTAARRRVEITTDELAMPPLRALGREATDRLIELLRPWAASVRAGGGVPGA